MQNSHCLCWWYWIDQLLKVIKYDSNIFCLFQKLKVAWYYKDKKTNQEQQAFLVNIVTQEPFELKLIDYLHLDNSKGGYSYLFIFVYHLTKNFSHQQQISLDSFPKHAIHDPGKKFENRLE